MSPFRAVLHNPALTMMKREVLLSQPDAFFAPLCQGRVPTVQEKLHLVEVMLQRITAFEVYENDTYTVTVRRRQPFIHLDISRRDEQPCKNWREFQQIKNELVGPDHEAIELFPSESRLVDTANQYHLWVLAEPTARFSVGFEHRFTLPEAVRMDSWFASTPPDADAPTPAIQLDGVVQRPAQHPRSLDCGRATTSVPSRNRPFSASVQPS